ncbi:MAG: efflux RND transporter periplasmic adaptor subunit [Anaerolineales bacterium]|jgi:HlyD family secretion protein
MESNDTNFSGNAIGLRDSSSAALDHLHKKKLIFSRVPKKFFWIGLFVVVIAGIVAGTYVFLHPAQTAASTSTGTLQTAIARQGDLVLQASGTGYLVAASESTVAFDVAGKISALDVKLGDTVEKGQLLAQLDDTSALTALDDAKQSLLELTSPEAVANAELAVTSAQSDVINAQYVLNNQLYWKNDSLIQEEYAGFVIAKANLDRAQAAYDKAEVGEYINNANEAQAYQTLYAATQAYNTAQYYYSLYSQKPTERQVNQAQASLDLANATLTNAKNYLAALTGGEVPEDATGSSLATLRQAQRTVQTAQENLDATKLYAPISGVVMTLDAKVGDSVSGTIMTIDDLSQADIQFYMDASDWTNVKVGYVVSVSFDSLPNQTFSGKVTEVMPGLVSTQGSTMVEGIAQLDDSVADIGLPVGVDAGIDVISGQAKNAVLVPVEALHELPDGSYTVFIMKNGTPTLTVVEVGLQSDTYAEIASGVAVGDVVTTGIVETSK